MTRTEIVSRLAELASEMKTHEEAMAATRSQAEQLMKDVMEDTSDE